MEELRIFLRMVIGHPPEMGDLMDVFTGTSNSLHPLRGIVGSNWETVQLDDGFRIRMRAIS